MRQTQRFSTKKLKTLWRWLRRILKFQLLPQLMPPESAKRVQKLERELERDASWSRNYIVCTICSCLIATFGLISNSTAVIIGAMLVAPLMLPLRGLAFSACEGDLLLFRKAASAIIGGTILALFLSWLIGAIVKIPVPGSEILARTQPNLIDLGIAVTAGGMSGFAKVRSGISDTLAGTAIAVALMPPLCVVGLTLSQSHYAFALGAFLLYVTNLLGITLACMLVFIFAGYTQVSHALGWASGLTALLVIPLGGSFFRLVAQQRLEAEIKHKLINETITVGQGVGNTTIDILWTTEPPTVYVFLETVKEITSRQVKLVQDYISQRMDREFRLIFYAIPTTEITAREAEIKPEKPEKPDNIPQDTYPQYPSPLLQKAPK